MAYNLQWEKDGVYVAFEGEVAAKEIMDVNNILYGDSRFEVIKYQIFDFLPVKKYFATELDAHLIGVLDHGSSRWNNKIKGAILTKDPDLIRLIKLYAGYLKDTNWKVEIFENIQIARDWVNNLK